MHLDTASYRTADLIARRVLAIGDGYRAKNLELGSVGLPFARAGNIDDGFDFDGADRFPEEELARVGEKVSRPGDVVFTSKGTVGRFAFVRDDTPRFVYSPQLCYWRSLDADAIDPRFLFYWLQGEEFWAQASAVMSQTDMADYVSLTDQRRMRITLPRISRQRAVGSVLGVLDDKIELNRQMNRTLEAMAAAHFKSWFVDFDPVVARAAGRQPFGMNSDLAGLFPSRFVDSELGPTPETWRIGRFSETVRIHGGGTPKTSVAEYWDGDVPWFSVVDTPRPADVFVIDTERRISEKGLEASAAQLLPELVTIVTARGTVGNLAVVGRRMAINQSCYALEAKPPYGPFLTYFRTRALIEDLRQRAHGSVFDTITRETFDSIKVAHVPEKLTKAFEDLAIPLMECIRANVLEVKTLVVLRDALLPKLLSGEIRAKDAEDAAVA
jgi:type I restriction enzyme S subunit